MGGEKEEKGREKKVVGVGDQPVLVAVTDGCGWVLQFAVLALFGDSARVTPGRPEELVMKDAGVLKCPMCHVPSVKKENVRWDMHGSTHGIVCVPGPAPKP